MTSYRLLHNDRTGHNVWREVPSGRFVISDHSADVSGDWRRPGDPRDTDDGVLYVDFTRPLRTRNASCLRVPLLTSNWVEVTADVRFDIVRKIERLSARKFGTPDPAPPRGGRGPARQSALNDTLRTRIDGEAGLKGNRYVDGPPSRERGVAYERYDNGLVRVWLLQEYHDETVWRAAGWIMPALPYTPHWRIDT